MHRGMECLLCGRKLFSRTKGSQISFLETTPREKMRRTVRPSILRLGSKAEEESSWRLEDEISVERSEHFVDGSLLI